MYPGDIYMQAFNTAVVKAEKYANKIGFGGITVITEGCKDAAGKRIILLWSEDKFEEIGAIYPYSGSFMQLADESVSKINPKDISSKMLEELKRFIDHS